MTRRGHPRRWRRRSLQAARFCPRLVMLHQGHVAADGPPKQVITRENLRRVYEADVRILEDPVSGAPLVVPAPEGN